MPNKELNKGFTNDLKVYAWVYWQTFKAICIGIVFYLIASYLLNTKIAIIGRADEVFKSPVTNIQPK